MIAACIGCLLVCLLAFCYMHHGVPYLRDSQSVNVKGNAHLPGPGLSPHQMTHDDYISITSLDFEIAFGGSLVRIFADMCVCCVFRSSVFVFVHAEVIVYI